MPPESNRPFTKNHGLLVGELLSIANPVLSVCLTKATGTLHSPARQRFLCITKAYLLSPTIFTVMLRHYLHQLNCQHRPQKRRWMDWQTHKSGSSWHTLALISKLLISSWIVGLLSQCLSRHTPK